MKELSAKQLENFFLEAMVKRWSAVPDEKTEEKIPGHSNFLFEKNGLQLVEISYNDKMNGFLYGGITVIQDGKPIWAMQYQGYCKPAAFSFLKAVLTDAYKDRRSIAGRGPLLAESRKYRYKGLTPIDRFGNFSGIETVWELAPSKHEPGSCLANETRRIAYVKISANWLYPDNYVT